MITNGIFLFILFPDDEATAIGRKVKFRDQRAKFITQEFVTDTGTESLVFCCVQSVLRRV